LEISLGREERLKLRRDGARAHLKREVVIARVWLKLRAIKEESCRAKNER
jgi:hypothetical protein